jgi:hypothetical protein
MITPVILNTIMANVSITFVFIVFLPMPCYIIVPGLSITATNANGRPRTSMCFLVQCMALQSYFSNTIVINSFLYDNLAISDNGSGIGSRRCDSGSL